MAKKRKVTLLDALNGSTDEEYEEFVVAMKKKRKLYWILALIPVVNWIFGGVLIFTRNTIRVVESRGRKQPGGVVNLLIGIWSWLLFPIVVGWILGKLPEGAQNKILGVDKLLENYHYE